MRVSVKKQKQQNNNNFINPRKFYNVYNDYLYSKKNSIDINFDDRCENIINKFKDTEDYYVMKNFSFIPFNSSIDNKNYACCLFILDNEINSINVHTQMVMELIKHIERKYVKVDVIKFDKFIDNKNNKAIVKIACETREEEVTND